MFFFIVVLGCWVMLYREINGRRNAAGQVAMPFLLLFIVFFWKKYYLAISDDFPIEIAMLISGLWLENMDDTFQTTVFTITADLEPGPTFFIIWLRKVLENLAYLLFLTDGVSSSSLAVSFSFSVWSSLSARSFWGRWADWR